MKDQFLVMQHDIYSQVKLKLKNGFPAFAEDGIAVRVLNPDSADDLNLLQEFRYNHYVESLKYVERPSHGKKIEYDKYDEHAVHFGAFDDRNILVGYTRLILPGQHGLQVHNEFEDLIHPRLDPARDMKKCIESSRFIVAPELGHRRYQAAQMLYKIKYQFVKRFGFKYWYQVSEMKLIRAHRHKKYPFKVIGEAKEYQGALCYPAAVDLDDFDNNLMEKAAEHYRWMNEGLEEINDYRDLVSRNFAFIDQSLQSLIKEKRVLFAGCGLGSSIAQLAVRMGFTKFIVADFDEVELSNLNRQAFMTGDIGKNKALQVSTLLTRINPHVKVKTVSERLSPSNIEQLISEADLIVNTVDFNETVYKINDIATSQGKPVFFPLNVGFGGILLVFNDQTITLQEMTAGTQGNVDFIRMLARSIKGFDIPSYVLPVVSELDMYENQGFLPQTGIAVNITASITVLAMIAYIAGWPLRLAPHVISSDALLAMGKEPSSNEHLINFKKHSMLFKLKKKVPIKIK